MKLTGEIISQENTGDHLVVTVANVTRAAQAESTPYGPNFQFAVHPNKARDYTAGRRVRVTIKVG